MIVVDDGSTDGSGAICDTYAERDARIRLIHQANAGLSAARNAAMDVMRGDFFVCVDSDDWLPEDALEQPMNVLAANPLIDILELGYTEINCRTGAERLVLAAGRELSSRGSPPKPRCPLWCHGDGLGEDLPHRYDGSTALPCGRPYEDTPFIFEALTRATRYRYLSWFGYCYRVARVGSITEVYDNAPCLPL